MESRRSLIKKGVFGSALLALGGGVGLALRRSKRVPLPDEGLNVLGMREYWVLDAIARRFILPKPGFPTVDELRVAYQCDRILARTDETSQMEVRQLLQLFENALTGFLLGGRVAPFTQLPPEQQDEVLSEWRTSALPIRRTGFSALRGLIMAAYYGDARTWPAVGYPGPPVAFHNPNAPVFKGPL